MSSAGPGSAQEGAFSPFPIRAAGEDRYKMGGVWEDRERGR